MSKRDYSYTQNRELSWLKFDQRVLEEAQDHTVPLLERLNFISIFNSNLDEFYMIRCGSLYDLTLIDEKDIDNKTGMDPQEQLDAIFKATKPLYKKRDEIYAELHQELRSYGIIRREFDELNSESRKYITQYFYENVAPLLSPQIIDLHHPFPHLVNGKQYIYCILEIEDQDKQNSKKNDYMGLIPVPSSLPDYIEFPGTTEFILMSDLIYSFTESIFTNHRVKYKTRCVVTRNGDVNLQQTPIDEDEDYRHYMKNILKKRKRLSPIRLEFYKDNNHKYTKSLRHELNLSKAQTFVSQTPLNLDYINKMIKNLPEDTRKELTYPPFTSQRTSQIVPHKSLFKQLDKKDILLLYPYHTMKHFLEFLKEAANDPEVLSIKITLYRLAKTSAVIKYLLEALDNEKDVTVLIELRARFDEKNNIHYAELLEETGCQILYGFENYKVHTKICTITKKHKGVIKQYTQIGTGNYNEKTANLYVDYCYLTSDETLGDDATEFFKNMALSNLNGHYDKLLVAPHGLRTSIISLIDEQIYKSQRGEPAEIIMKMNSFTDRKIIDKIVEASQNGVKIKMIIRGICCIIPGLKDKTENIEVRSIVGRYLEHSRIYVFGTGDNIKLYISSADMMTRNTAKRVEIACPIEDPKIKSMILEDIDVMLKDDIKGRRINTMGDYEKIQQARHTNAQEYFQERALEEVKDHPEITSVKHNTIDTKHGIVDRLKNFANDLFN
ncbi:MAG: RNA degradosome polyphosphate kinase [Methanosphaera sp.]|nr:RNA degradosome polyphosphate kinase [Methanosphaera sp.]